MKILMLASEAAPFAKTGGLADAVSALARAIRGAGHDVRILMPYYSSIGRSGIGLLRPFLPCGYTRSEYFDLHGCTLPGSDVIVYLVGKDELFGRDGIYGEDADYPDNPRRFGFLCRAAFSACRAEKWIPEILHLHDWQAAPAAVYLSERERYREFAFSACLLTIHNLGYQGLYPESRFPELDLPWEAFHGAGFEDFGRLNILKAGILRAEMLSTVSPTYAREIQTPAQGFGLDAVLRQRSRRLVGILNGIDQADWNPARDQRIARRFDLRDMSGKAECKAALQREFGLPERPNTPLFAFASRLADQKGIRELFWPGSGCAAQACADMDIQIVAAGSGERWCETEMSSLAERLPSFKSRVGYSEDLARRIMAGADFLLMPCRYEPCGLNQMYAMRYGTLPLARRTGGLADTIRNYDQDSGDGTGFLLDDLTPRSLYDTIGWAAWAYYNRREHVEAMRLRAMSQDFSWAEPVREYISLYSNALKAISSLGG